MPKPIIYVTTWCKDDQLLYGSTLVFDSIRVGFPNSEIVVLENMSIETARAAIVAAARAADCRIRLLDKELPHWKIVETLCMSENRPFVVLDPDIAMWESVEDWEFGGALMAGRLIAGNEAVGSRYNLPRLHSSHLWFPDPIRLRDRISSIAANGAPIWKLFRGGRMPRWLLWDTADILYLALGEEAVPFTEAQLDAYDHLFAGSYLPDLLAELDQELGDAVAGWHEAARTDYRLLKGSWRKQQEVVDSIPWNTAAASRPWRSQVLDHALNPGWLGHLRHRLFGQSDGPRAALAKDLNVGA